MARERKLHVAKLCSSNTVSVIKAAVWHIGASICCLVKCSVTALQLGCQFWGCNIWTHNNCPVETNWHFSAFKLRYCWSKSWYNIKCYLFLICLFSLFLINTFFWGGGYWSCSANRFEISLYRLHAFITKFCLIFSGIYSLLYSTFFFHTSPSASCWHCICKCHSLGKQRLKRRVKKRAMMDKERKLARYGTLSQHSCFQFVQFNLTWLRSYHTLWVLI